MFFYISFKRWNAIDTVSQILCQSLNLSYFLLGYDASISTISCLAFWVDTNLYTHIHIYREFCWLKCISTSLIIIINFLLSLWVIHRCEQPKAKRIAMKSLTDSRHQKITPNVGNWISNDTDNLDAASLNCNAVFPGAICIVLRSIGLLKQMSQLVKETPSKKRPWR